MPVPQLVVLVSYDLWVQLVLPDTPHETGGEEGEEWRREVKAEGDNGRKEVKRGHEGQHRGKKRGGGNVRKEEMDRKETTNKSISKSESSFPWRPTCRISHKARWIYNSLTLC